MMSLFSKIFLDGGDPEETKEGDLLLKKAGFRGIEGQTTNPSLIVKNLVQKSKGNLQKVPQQQALSEYRRRVLEMAKITSGPISIQVFANAETKAEDMLSQARAYKDWISNAVIKFPCTCEGLKAAWVFCKEGPVNITLVFTQEQAAAAQIATNGAGFISPFIGRLDDVKQNGMDVVSNILKMFKQIKGARLKVITASVRSISHILYALWLKSDVITIPYSVLKAWEVGGFPLPEKDFLYNAPDLKEIPYRDLALDKDWRSYDISHPLTEAGVCRFWQDWQKIVE